MNKPITLARKEFIEKIVAACNESQLPAFVVADVLGEAEKAARELAEKQLAADAEAWEAANSDNGPEKNDEILNE